MNNELKHQLIAWAEEYEQPDFIKNDPVQFPHRFTDKKDIEISAFITSWLSYGNRKLILKAVEKVHEIMGKNPYKFIVKRGYKDFEGNRNTLYRLFTYHDFFVLCERLNEIYDKFPSMEKMILSKLVRSKFIRNNKSGGVLLYPLVNAFSGCKGVPNDLSSPCKRLCMFLRWMIRQQSPVDLGVWCEFSQRRLIIPVDTHVHRIALELGITSRRSNDFKTAVEITSAMRKVFPNDPLRGDFALFGYGINHKSPKK